MLPDLYIWVDDSVGLGHKMQTLPIAEEWAKRGGVVFTSGTPSKPSIILFDGYAWQERAYALWHDAGHLVMVFDDHVRSPQLAAHVFIDKNHRAWQKGHAYPRVKQLCLGAAFMPIRQDYLGITVTEETDLFDADAPGRKMPPAEFAAHMAAAKVVACSAGITPYEALFLRKPILLRMVADNQAWTFEKLIEDGYAFPETQANLERFLSSENEREAQALRIGSFVDGMGAARICDTALREWHILRGN